MEKQGSGEPGERERGRELKKAQESEPG